MPVIRRIENQVQILKRSRHCNQEQTCKNHWTGTLVWEGAGEDELEARRPACDHQVPKKEHSEDDGKVPSSLWRVGDFFTENNK